MSIHLDSTGIGQTDGQTDSTGKQYRALLMRDKKLKLPKAVDVDYNR